MTFHIILRHTGLAAWQWEAGSAAGLIPPPDNDGRWSRAAADAIAARLDEIVAAVGTEPPVGGHRAADRLGERTGLPVAKADVEALAEALAEADALTAAGWYKGWPLWSCRDLDALAADEALAEQLRADRLVIGVQAAAHLEIRATDFRYLVAADLAVPHSHTSVQVTRYRWVDVPLYRTGDLDVLRECPVIDWEAARAVRPGEPSPLRHLARRPVDRAATVRRWVAQYGDRHGIEVFAWFHPGAGRWEVDFERVRGGPRVKDVRAAIAAHRYLREYPIAVATAAGAAIRWARAMREPGQAVILDTETTDPPRSVVHVPNDCGNDATADSSDGSTDGR